MAIGSIGSTPSPMVQSLVDLRSQLNDLQTQLGTGKKSTTYSGLGVDAGLVVGLRGQLSAISGYSDTITNVGTRIDLENSVLGRISDLGSAVKDAQADPFQLNSSGQTIGQQSAASQLDEALGLLNTQDGNRYLFSGRATDTPATDTTDHILNGDGAKAGFKQVLSERNQADLGADGLGRLVIPAASGSQVSISEDAAGSPFGFKLAGVNSTLTGATVTGPTGSPAGITVNLAANPNPGDTISFSFNLPDGTSEKIALTATTSSPAAAGQFTIGADPTATAANLQSALTSSVSTLAQTSLSAASSVAAANDFFNADGGQPPMRVNGPPFDTATSLVAGTSANTVSWYTGETGTDPARGTAVAQVDDTLSVSYGVRGNEQAIRSTIASMAVFASTTFSASDPNASARYAALTQRLGTSLDNPPGQPTIQDIQAQLADAQTTMQAASDRQTQKQSTLQGMLDGVEGVSQEQVAAQILALQTQFQASLQTTAMLYQMSILNYLPAGA